MAAFKIVGIDAHIDLDTHMTVMGGYPVTVDRHADWLTAAYWYDPQANIEDFLRVAEEMFKQGEEHGWEADYPGKVTVVVCSPKLDDTVIVEGLRPIEVEDFEELGVETDDIDLLRINTDLAQVTFCPQEKQLGVLFYEKPHQTRSAFQFMAELIPAKPKLEPKEIGTFVLGLHRQ